MPIRMCLCPHLNTPVWWSLNYSPFNERIPKCQEHYHIHLHISASQVFKKSSFSENKSSVISNLDRRIRNYLGNYCRNDAKQPIHLLTRLVLAAMCKKLQFPYSPCPHTRITFRHSLIEWTIVYHTFREWGTCFCVTLPSLYTAATEIDQKGPLLSCKIERN